MRRNQRGETVLEVLITATVAIFVVSALTFATIFSLRNANFSKISAQATKLAQEGIEIVRSGRNRNLPITGSLSLGGKNVYSWDGKADGTEALWDAQISANCTPNCYFNIVNKEGVINYISAGSIIPDNAEPIPQTSFKRVVVLSDDADYQTQKKVTVIVTWNDFAGGHESKLTTVLGRKF